MKPPKHWHLQPDPVSAILGTGFQRLSVTNGIGGLVKIIDPSTLEVLAVHSSTPGNGQFRKFIDEAKECFNEIYILEIWSPFLGEALKRYGFEPFARTEPDGERISGFKWSLKPAA